MGGADRIGSASQKTSKDPKEKEKDAPNTLAFVFAGATRTLLLSLKKMGISGAMLGNFTRKQAFLTLGRRTGTQVSSLSPVPVQAVEKSVNKSFTHKAADIIKGAVLGFSVFGIYEFLIVDQRSKDAFRIDSTALARKEHTKLVWMQAMVRPAMENSFIFGAGALAGLAQSMVMDMWEVGSYWWHHRNDIWKRRSLQHVNKKVNYKFIGRRAIHHSLGYATLFGCYEMIRCYLSHKIFCYFSSGSPSVPRLLDNLENFGLVQIDKNGVYDMTVVPISAAFVAGGLAGQAQFVVNHYTRHWKIRALKHTEVKSGKTLIPRPPGIRATASAFLPTALCFVAFQYGAEMTERWLKEEDPRRPFPVYIWAG